MNEKEAQEWPERPWGDVAECLMRQSFCLELQDRVGTAFLVSQTQQSHAGNRGFCFATAWHVIEGFQDAQTITLYRQWPARELLLDRGSITILQLGPPDKFDLGLFIVSLPKDVLLPEHMLPVRGGEQCLDMGQEIGWYGFPASLGRQPLFVVGRTAALATEPYRYLSTGAAYPGMSGGGVVDAKCHVVGVISSWWTDPYLPNGQGLVQIMPSQMIRHVLEDRMKAKVL